MSAFDDLTLGEVDEIRDTCLGGKNINDPTVDPLTLAGAVMWASQRKQEPALDWDKFKANTRMGDIKAFSQQMQAEDDDEELNP